jgi:hypothetical protein
MFSITGTALLNSALRQDLYRVWIRAHEGPNAPLVSIWIDPAMRAFEASLAETPRHPSMAPNVETGLDPWTAEDDDHPRPKELADLNRRNLVNSLMSYPSCDQGV